jgi:hypothetical protein
MRRKVAGHRFSDIIVISWEGGSRGSFERLGSAPFVDQRVPDLGGKATGCRMPLAFSTKWDPGKYVLVRSFLSRERSVSAAGLCVAAL